MSKTIMRKGLIISAVFLKCHEIIVMDGYFTTPLYRATECLDEKIAYEFQPELKGIQLLVISTSFSWRTVTNINKYGVLTHLRT